MDAFIDLIIGILLGMVLTVLVMLAWQWNRLKPASISLPMLIEATNLALLAGGFGMIAIVLAGIIYFMFPQDEGFMMGFETPLWKIVLMYTLVFLMPPQLMWIKRIRKSMIGAVLIALLWGRILTATQAVRLESVSPYMMISLLGFGLAVVGICLNRMRRINSRA